LLWSGVTTTMTRPQRTKHEPYGLPAPPRENGVTYMHGLELVEPHVVEAMASTEQPFPWGSSPEPLSEEALDRLHDVLDRLLPRDKEILMWSAEGMPQAEMGRRLGITQSSVSLRIKGALERARVLAKRPDWTTEEFRARLVACRCHEREIQAAVIYWHRPNMAEVAHTLGVPWSTARDRVNRAIARAQGTELGRALTALRVANYCCTPPRAAKPARGRQRPSGRIA